ncbi:MAG: hypothetical protein AB7Y46_03600 [Armatimonadota bacterium]
MGPASAAICALLLATAACAATRQVTIPLEIAAGQSCPFDARGAELLGKIPAPNADGLIAIEAEDLVRHHFDPKVRLADAPMPKDPEAAGGAHLDRATFASYEFTADRASDWWLWVRVRTG